MPDDAEGPAAQLPTREGRALPLAAPHGCVGRRGLAGQAVEQREGVLGGRDRVAGRGVDDGDARPRRRVEVDVVHADPGPPDDDEARARGDQRRIDLDLAADDQGVVLGQDRAQLVARETGAHVDLVIAAQDLETLRGDRFGDQDLHAPAPAGAGTARP